jgi:hypothetical protein
LQAFRVRGDENGSCFLKKKKESTTFDHLIFKHKTDLQVKKSQKLCQLPTREVQLASCYVGSITVLLFLSLSLGAFFS